MQTVKIGIPDGVEFVAGSVSIDAKLTPYSYQNGTLAVITNKPSGIIRFCVAPVEAGEHIVDAFLSFTHEGSAVIQPIGQVTLCATALNLELPSKTGSRMVKLFDNDVQAGETTSNANGSWQISFALIDPEINPSHEIYAEITTP